MKTHEVETLDPRDKFHGPVHKPHFHMKFFVQSKYQRDHI